MGRVDLQAAYIGVPAVAQGGHQRAVAAPDVEHARAGRHLRGDQREIGAQSSGFGGGHRPASMKPEISRHNSGESSRKASWPNGLDKDRTSTRLNSSH